MPKAERSVQERLNLEEELSRAPNEKIKHDVGVIVYKLYSNKFPDGTDVNQEKLSCCLNTDRKTSLEASIHDLAWAIEYYSALKDKNLPYVKTDWREGNDYRNAKRIEFFELAEKLLDLIKEPSLNYSFFDIDLQFAPMLEKTLALKCGEIKEYLIENFKRDLGATLEKIPTLMDVSDKNSLLAYPQQSSIEFEQKLREILEKIPTSKILNAHAVCAKALLDSVKGKRPKSPLIYRAPKKKNRRALCSGIMWAWYVATNSDIPRRKVNAYQEKSYGEFYDFIGDILKITNSVSDISADSVHKEILRMVGKGKHF